MEHLTINAKSDVPEHLQQAYLAAHGLQMATSLYKVRDEVALWADGALFDPERNTAQALSLVFKAQFWGVLVRIITSAQDTRVQIGASRWYVVDNLSNPERALRRAIVRAFATEYEKATT
jgi:hypothetical protein